MRRFWISMGCGLLVLLVVGGIWLLSRRSQVALDDVHSGSVRFHYGETDISGELSQEDLAAITAMFQGKVLHDEHLSCGFSDEISVTLNNDQVFCIACDSCPFVFYKNEELHFQLSEEENLHLRSILERCGFVFPCV